MFRYILARSFVRTIFYDDDGVTSFSYDSFIQVVLRFCEDKHSWYIQGGPKNTYPEFSKFSMSYSVIVFFNFSCKIS